MKVNLFNQFNQFIILSIIKSDNQYKEEDPIFNTWREGRFDKWNEVKFIKEEDPNCNNCKEGKPDIWRWVRELYWLDGRMIWVILLWR